MRLLGLVCIIGALVLSPISEARPASGRFYEVQVMSIYDGDTFKINLPGLPPELNPVGIRVRGVDTPEIKDKAKCASENALGMRARATTVGWIAQTRGKVEIGNLDWDKYGGRIDADVRVGVQRQSLAALLIANGYARPYHGGRRRGWCGV